MENLLIVVVGLLAAGAGALVGQKMYEAKVKTAGEDAKSKADKLLHAAEVKTAKLEGEGKERALKLVESARKDAETIRNKINNEKNKVAKLEAKLEGQKSALTEKEKDLEKAKEILAQQAQEMATKKKKLENIHQEVITKLEGLTNLTKEEAKAMLLDRVEKEYADEILKKMQAAEADAEEQAEEKSKFVIAHAIQKYASEVTSESTVTIVQIPNEELKGRIIGKEGRNINAFEQATGVDVIIDDSPESIIISGFDLVRRYVAKIALESLMSDGRIQPTRIEEEVAKAENKVNKMIKEFGEKACMECGVTGLHPNLVKLLGRLRFRTSYGQNVLKHTIEVCNLSVAMAEMMGADVKMCRYAGILHDIGKAVSHEVEGSHVDIGREILKKYKVPEEWIEAGMLHHDDPPFETLEAYIIKAADAISASRPGARREQIEQYIKRLRELENIANSYSGVKKSFAIQAGREVRVLVDPEEISDLEAMKIAKKIARQYEGDMDYPGQIKVNVMRETRNVEYAK